MREYIFKIIPEYADKRLDLCLMQFFQEQPLAVSRTFVQDLIHDGLVLVNDVSIKKPHHKIKLGDCVTVRYEQKEKKPLMPENIPLEIIYQDDDIALINKPIGLVTHPAPGNREHTLVNALCYHIKHLSSVNPERPGIVHRLDKDTSGVMVVAKNDAAHINLVKQFAKHSIKRRYIAVVHGKMEFDEHIIEAAVGRHPYKRKEMAVGVCKNAKYAKTFYRTLKRANGYSLLELEPFTGRTHQLRVHLASISHPILGDIKYGKNDGIKRLALHAQLIGFQHPATGKFVEFETQVPKEFFSFFELLAISNQSSVKKAKS